MVCDNGDYVSATYVSDRGVEHYPFKTGFANVENIPVSYTHLDVYKRQPLVYLLFYQRHGRVAKFGRDKR